MWCSACLKEEEAQGQDGRTKRPRGAGFRRARRRGQRQQRRRRRRGGEAEGEDEEEARGLAAMVVGGCLEGWRTGGGRGWQSCRGGGVGGGRRRRRSGSREIALLFFRAARRLVCPPHIRSALENLRVISAPPKHHHCCHHHHGARPLFLRAGVLRSVTGREKRFGGCDTRVTSYSARARPVRPASPARLSLRSCPLGCSSCLPGVVPCIERRGRQRNQPWPDQPLARTESNNSSRPPTPLPSPLLSRSPKHSGRQHGRTLPPG
jgi:hypothetical protein